MHTSGTGTTSGAAARCTCITACIVQRVQLGVYAHAQSLGVVGHCRVPPRVLIPGAGLGRLPYEVALHGYISEGNEWSYFMLLGSDFILNRPREAPRYSIQPWVHQQSNVQKREDQFRSICVPDGEYAKVACLCTCRNCSAPELHVHQQAVRIVVVVFLQ